MPIDETRLLRATGRMLVRPEIEEFENAFQQVTETWEYLRFSAQVAVAFDTVIHKHDIAAFGYDWWGERELITQLRAQSRLVVSPGWPRWGGRE